MTVGKTTFVMVGALVAGMAAGWLSKFAVPPKIQVVSYSDAVCGCCRLWAEHMEANGFEVREVIASPSQVEGMHEGSGVPADLRACHFAKVEGRFVVGHVPADIVQRMLNEGQAIAGVGVDGMPLGAPGMDTGAQKEPYEVIAIFDDRRTTVYQQIVH